MKLKISRKLFTQALTLNPSPTRGEGLESHLTAYHHGRIRIEGRKLRTFSVAGFLMRVVGVLAAGLILTACQQDEGVLPTLLAPGGVQPKQLATVVISPTPNQAEQQATRSAIIPTTPEPTLTLEPSPTVYVGIFLEGSVISDDDLPFVDPTRAVFQPDTTPIVSRCRFEIADNAFGSGWRTNINAVRAIGCPVEGLQQFRGTFQPFERGAMYYQEDGGLWAITTEGGARGDRYWSLPAVPLVITELPIAPSGLQLPDENFIGMWLGVEEVRDRLGFARLSSQPSNLALQRFENGALLSDGSSGVVYILLGSNMAFGPYS